MMPETFHFASLHWAWLLLAVPLIPALYARLFRQRLQALHRLGSARWRRYSVRARDPRKAWRRSLLLTVAWFGMVVALMAPRGNPMPRTEAAEIRPSDIRVSQVGEDLQEVTLRRKAHSVIFLIDASASMAVADTRTGVSRLDYAKDIVDEVISGLNGQEVALYAFTSELTNLVPATYDYLYARLMLRRLAINEGDVAGTDLLEALEGLSAKHLQEDQDKVRSVILLTDGGDTRIEQLTGQARDRELNTLLSRLGNPEASNLQFFSLGLGTEQGAEIPGLLFEGEAVVSTLDQDLLQQLSDRGRGRYYPTNSVSTLTTAEDLIQRILEADRFVDEQALLPSAEIERLLPDPQELEYTEYFTVPLAIALLCLTLALGLKEHDS